MKKFATLAAMLAIGLTSIAPAVAEAPVCLRTNWIDSTHVLNSRTILFRMKGGKVWRNTLLNSCPGLSLSGFSYVVHNDEICGGAQAIFLIRGGEVCLLGPFTPETTGHS